MTVFLLKLVTNYVKLINPPFLVKISSEFPSLNNNINKHVLSRSKCFKSSNSNESGFGKYKYQPELEDEINTQINREQYASRTYLAIASYFGNVNVSRKGCYHFFIEMHREETQHAGSLIKYQLQRGGKVIIKDLQAPTLSETTLLQYFEKALQMEIDITVKLDNLIALAETFKDYHCADYITAEFMKEQIHSINMLSNIVKNLHNLGNNEINMYVFDLELEKKYSKSVL